MPISRSAKKSLRKSVTNRKSNVSFKNKLKEIVKNFLVKPEQKALQEAQSMVDKAVKKGIVHKNKAARLKSQLSKKVGTTTTEPKKTTKRTAKEKMSK